MSGRSSELRDVPFPNLVPGDVIHLSAGDMIPADVRLLRAKDLFISQSVLTGEAMPVEKYDTLGDIVEKSCGGLTAMPATDNPLDRNNLCFMGTNIVSGSGTAVVVTTGSRTYLGSLARSVVGQRSMTSFDKGINSVTWVLIKFILVMVPIVFLLNFSNHDRRGGGSIGDGALPPVSLRGNLTDDALRHAVDGNELGTLAVQGCQATSRRFAAVLSSGGGLM